MKKLVALILIFALALPLAACTGGQYRDAQTLISQGEYQKAKELLLSLGDYENSAGLILECERALAYEAAVALMDEGDYSAARSAFLAIQGYRDAEELVTTCIYYEDYSSALAYMKAQNYSAAAAAFSALGDFEDSLEKRLECEKAYAYARAGARFSARDYRSALALYREASGYKNAADMATMCQKRIIVQTAMQRLISAFQYNAGYSLEDISSLIAGVKDFEQAAELEELVSLLVSGDTGGAAEYYLSLESPYVIASLARGLILKTASKNTLSDYRARAFLNTDGAASLADRAFFDANIKADIQKDEKLAALLASKATLTNGADAASPESTQSNAASSSPQGASNGKVMVYERTQNPVTGAYTGEIYMGAYSMLSPELIPEDFSQVEYVILIDRSGAPVTAYEGGALGIQQNCTVRLIHLPDMGELAHYGDFAGGLPPEDYTPVAATETNVATSDVAPSDVTPSDVTPSDVTPSDTTPSDATPSDATPSDVTPSDVTPSDATPSDVAETPEPIYVMGEAPDEKLILSAVRTALVTFVERYEGDFGYIVTKMSDNVDYAVITSFKGAEFIFPRDVDGLQPVGFAPSLLLRPEAAEWTTLTLPASLTNIPAGAFKLLKLTKLKLPASIEYIGENAFPQGLLLDVEENSYAHYWAIARAWPHTVSGAQSTDECAPLTSCFAEGTVAYSNVAALSQLLPWPEYATPLSSSSDGRFAEFGNMDETRYVNYIRELIAAGLFEKFNGFTYKNGVCSATLTAGEYEVNVQLEDGILLVEVA